jgi:glycine/D-amino acid oxidase-like deaminating enzyme
MNSALHDVLVIGAGLTGAVIAAHLAEQGARVGVIDAAQVGGAATRRALGVATISPTIAHVEETTRGIDLLKHLAARQGVLLNSCSTLHLASTAERQAALRALATGRNAASRIEWTERADVLPGGFDGGLIAHDSALVDIDQLIVKLLQQRAINVRQNAEAIRLETRDGITYALCRDYTIGARSVVLATNAYVGLLSPYLAESLRPARGAVWTSRPLREGGQTRFSMPLLIDDGTQLLMPDKDSRLRASAWLWNGQAAGEDPSTHLHRFLMHLDGGLLGQTEQWITGVTTGTDDGAPLVGRLDADGAVLYALGLGPYGLAWSAIVAERVAALAR